MRLSTSRKMAMIETTILIVCCLPIKSTKCLDARDRNEKLRLTGGTRLDFYTDHVRVPTDSDATG